MRIKLILFISLALMNQAFVWAQVGISLDTLSPDPSAMLDIRSTEKGLLIPRLSTAQRNLIASPAIGLQVFNLDDHCIDIYDGLNWIKQCGLQQTGMGDSIGTNIWTRKTDFGGIARSLAVSFSIGSKAFVGTGSTGSGSASDFWSYNSLTNTWTQLASMPLPSRYGAVAFSIGDKGYVGTGYSSASGFALNDFWEFDPVTNSWSPRASFGGGLRVHAAAFSIGNKGYVGTGLTALTGGIATKDFWEYDPATDVWTQKADFGGDSRRGTVSFSIGNKGYMGLGISGNGSYLSDFFSYDPGTDSWTPTASFPGTLPAGRACFSVGNIGYVGPGLLSSGVWAYSPISDSWAGCPIFPGQDRGAATGFSLGNKGYVVTGATTIGSRLRECWEYTPPVSAPRYSSIGMSGGFSSFNDGLWTLEQNNLYNNTGNVGIGTSSPGTKLDVDGQVRIRGGNPGAGKILSSDYSGLASWVVPNGSIASMGFLTQSISTSILPQIPDTWHLIGYSPSVYMNGNQRVYMFLTLGLGRTTAGAVSFNLDGGYSDVLNVLHHSDNYTDYSYDYHCSYQDMETLPYSLTVTFKPFASGYITLGPMMKCPTPYAFTKNSLISGFYIVVNE